jgi:hypothetical protein
MKQFKFKFKTVKLTGRNSWTNNPTKEIFLNNNKIGVLVKLISNSYKNYGDNDNKIAIRFTITKNPTKENPANFEWKTVKLKFNTFEEAEIFIKKTPQFLNYNFHFLK